MDDPSPSPAGRPPWSVWALTALASVMAFVAVVGSFLFAFPMGAPLGYIVGPILIVYGLGYATIAWRMRLGERKVWFAALALPIVHVVTLNGLDLALYGAIPPEDYPFMAVAAAMVVLVLLPVTRRFFGVRAGR